MKYTLSKLKELHEREAAWKAELEQSLAASGSPMPQLDGIDIVNYIYMRLARKREEFFKRQYSYLLKEVKLATDEEFEARAYQGLPDWYMHERKDIYERERRLDQAYTTDKIPGCSLDKAEAVMIEGLQQQGVDVTEVQVEFGFWRNRKWLILISWKTITGWLPALSWSFGGGYPTTWSAAICLAA